MRVVCLDFETYYDEEYSLKKLSPEAYVRDARFKPLILTWTVDSEPVQCASGSEEIQRVLESLDLKDHDTWTFAHNMKFDGFICEQYFKTEISHPICTIAMGRFVGISRIASESQASFCEVLDTPRKLDYLSSTKGKIEYTDYEWKQFIEYAIRDTEGLRENVRKMLPFCTLEALEFIAMTIKMYTSPVFVLDVKLLREYRARLEQERTDTQERLSKLFNFQDTESFLKSLRSKDKFCEMLRSIGGTIPYKLSEKKTATKTKALEKAIGECSDPVLVSEMQQALLNGSCRVMEPALAKSDLEFKALLEHEDSNISMLANARAGMNSSMAMSRCDRFLAVAERGTLPVPLEAYLARTGRYTGGQDSDDSSGDKLNLQNLNKHKGDKTLRYAIQAPPGHVIVAADSAQIEARMIAWLAGEHSLLDGFRNNRDVYVEFAAIPFHRSVEDLLYYAKGDGRHDAAKHARADMQRQVGKKTVLSSQYGAGGKNLALKLAEEGVMTSFTLPDGTEDSSWNGHEQECLRIVRMYRQVFPALPAFWKLLENVLMALYKGEQGYFGGPENKTLFFDGNHEVFGKRAPGIRLPDGYWIVYPELHQRPNDEGRMEWMCSQFKRGKKVYEHLWYGTLANNVTQGLAFALMREQALFINRVIPVKMNVHDEWVTIVPKSQEQEAKALLDFALRQCPVWAPDLPLSCDVVSGTDYGHMEE